MLSKIYPNWEFGFENKPSGNPGFIAQAQKTKTLFLRKSFGADFQIPSRQWLSRKR
jgi:hypothetical protein